MPTPVSRQAELDLALEAAHDQLHRAARRHRVAGVEREVRDHLLELPRSARTRQPGSTEVESSTSSPRSRESRLSSSATTSPRSSTSGSEHLAAAEGEQLARERRGAIGGAHDLERVCAARVVGVEAGNAETRCSRRSRSAGC